MDICDRVDAGYLETLALVKYLRTNQRDTCKQACVAWKEEEVGRNAQLQHTAVRKDHRKQLSQSRRADSGLDLPGRTEL